jgi:ketosteroid isomerase-like protein
LEALARRVQGLEAAEQVRQALASYSRAVDQRDLKALEDHFAADARYQGSDGVAYEGRDVIVRLFAARFAELPQTDTGRVHYVTNFEVAVSDDGRAVATSTFLMAIAGAGPLLRMGHYRDEFVIGAGFVRCVDKVITSVGLVPIPTTAG